MKKILISLLFLSAVNITLCNSPCYGQISRGGRTYGSRGSTQNGNRLTCNYTAIDAGPHSTLQIYYEDQNKGTPPAIWQYKGETITNQ
jgi:hypothetical protein